jgi:peptide/nickel transport system substrate-binding protein
MRAGDFDPLSVFRRPCRPAALLCAFLAFAAFAGCTRVGTSSSSAGNPWTHHGLLRIVNINEPDSLNPLVGNFQIDSDLAYIWGGYFFNYDDRNEFVPELATVVPTLENGGISRDNRTITYHLRKGVRWQDGPPFTADDVIFTWHAVMNKRNNVPSTVGYDLIDSIQRTDAWTIVVHLKRPYAPFISTFFGPCANPYVVLPAHLLAKFPDLNRIEFNSRPVGTGPFVVERWQRGSKIVFRANPDYWRGPPKLREIWYTPIPDENTVVTLLKSHEADLDFNAAIANYPQLRNVEGTRVMLTPFTQFGQLVLNLRSPQLADVRVRRALWLALDVKGLIRDVTHGVNVPGYTDQPSFQWAYNPNVAHYDYDPAKARALLDAAGWKVGSDGIRVKDGKRLQLALIGVQGSANGNATAVITQRDWHDVGIEALVKTYVSPLFFATYGAGGIIQTGKFDIAFLSWLNGVDPDDSTLWMCDQFPPAGQNAYHFCDPRVDAAERLALGTNDRGVRKRAYATIQTVLADQVPVIITWYTRRLAVANTDLQNYRPAHAVTSFWNPYEWQI